MDDYLIDREILSEFVDNLIKQKPVSANNVEELDAFREKLIKELDGQIAQAVYGNLNPEQVSELQQVRADESADEESFKNFFAKCGINLEQSITRAMEDFGINFLGGRYE